MRKTISFCLAVTFFVTSMTLDPSYASVATESFDLLSLRQTQKELQKTLYKMPEEWGTIAKYWEPSGAKPGKPFIIHIQDAHSNPGASGHIASILQYLEDHHPGMAVGLEGASGELHPEYLQLFKNFPQVNRAVIEDLQKKGELNGAELFLLGKHQTLGNTQRTTKSEMLIKPNVYGVEDLELYRKNLQTYRELLLHRDEIQTWLTPIRAKLETESSQALHPELRAFLKERSRRKNGRFNFNATSADPDLQVYLSYLSKQASKVLKIDLSDFVEQLRFPNLVRWQRIEAVRKDFELEKARKEWAQVLARLKIFARQKGEKEFVTALTAFGRTKGFLDPKTEEAYVPLMDPVLYPRKLLEGLFQFSKKYKISFSDQAAFLNSWKLLIFQTEIDVTGLVAEIDQLEQGLTQKLARSDKEKELVQHLENLELMEKLLGLELTRPEYDKAVLEREGIEALSMGSFSKKPKGTGNQSMPVPFGALSPFLAKAWGFYEVSLARDQTLVNNLLFQVSKAKNSKKGLGVLYTGGFHSQGISDLLEQQGIGYAVVTPRISSVDHGERYQKVMAGDNADLSAYFKVKNPFTTKQEAIFFKQLVEVAAPALFEKYQMQPQEIANHLAEAVREHPLLSKAVTALTSKNPEDPVVHFQTRVDSKGTGNHSMPVPFALRELSADQATVMPEPITGTPAIVIRDGQPLRSLTTTVSFGTAQALTMTVTPDGLRPPVLVDVSTITSGSDFPNLQPIPAARSEMRDVNAFVDYPVESAVVERAKKLAAQGDFRNAAALLVPLMSRGTISQAARDQASVLTAEFFLYGGLFTEVLKITRPLIDDQTILPDTKGPLCYLTGAAENALATQQNSRALFQHAIYHLNLALEILMPADRASESEIYQRLAVDIHNQLGMAHFNLGGIAKREKNLEEFRSQFDRALGCYQQALHQVGLELRDFQTEGFGSEVFGKLFAAVVTKMGIRFPELAGEITANQILQEMKRRYLAASTLIGIIAILLERETNAEGEASIDLEQLSLIFNLSIFANALQPSPPYRQKLFRYLGQIYFMLHFQVADEQGAFMKEAHHAFAQEVITAGQRHHLYVAASDYRWLGNILLVQAQGASASGSRERATGLRKEAVQQFQTALKIDPSDTASQQKLMQMKVQYPELAQDLETPGEWQARVEAEIKPLLKSIFGSEPSASCVRALVPLVGPSIQKGEVKNVLLREKMLLPGTPKERTNQLVNQVVSLLRSSSRRSEMRMANEAEAIGTGTTDQIISGVSAERREGLLAGMLEKGEALFHRVQVSLRGKLTNIVFGGKVANVVFGRKIAEIIFSGKFWNDELDKIYVPFNVVQLFHFPFDFFKPVTHIRQAFPESAELAFHILKDHLDFALFIIPLVIVSGTFNHQISTPEISFHSPAFLVGGEILTMIPILVNFYFSNYFMRIKQTYSEGFAPDLSPATARSETRGKRAQKSSLGTETKLQPAQTQFNRRKWLIVLGVIVPAAITTVGVWWLYFRPKPWSRLQVSSQEQDPEKRLQMVRKALSEILQWLIDEGYPHPEVLRKYQNQILHGPVEDKSNNPVFVIGKDAREGRIFVNSHRIIKEIEDLQKNDSPNSFIDYAKLLIREAWGYELAPLFQEYLQESKLIGRLNALIVMNNEMQALQRSNALSFKDATRRIFLDHEQEIIDLAATALSFEVLEDFFEYEGIAWLIQKELYRPDPPQKKGRMARLLETKGELVLLIRDMLAFVSMLATFEGNKTATTTSYNFFLGLEQALGHLDIQKLVNAAIREKRSYLFPDDFAASAIRLQSAVERVLKDYIKKRPDYASILAPLLKETSSEATFRSSIQVEAPRSDSIKRSEARDKSSRVFSVLGTVQKPAQNFVPRTPDSVLSRARSEMRNDQPLEETEIRGAGSAVSEIFGRVAFFNPSLTEEILFPPFSADKLTSEMIGEIIKGFDVFTDRLRENVSAYEAEGGKKIPRAIRRHLERLIEEIRNAWQEAGTILEQSDGMQTLVRETEGRLFHPYGYLLKELQKLRAQEKSLEQTKEWDPILDTVRRTAFEKSRPYGEQMTAELAEEELCAAEEVLRNYRVRTKSTETNQKKEKLTAEAVKRLIEQGEKFFSSDEGRTQKVLEAIEKTETAFGAEEAMLLMRKDQVAIVIAYFFGENFGDVLERQKMKDKMIRENRGFASLFIEAVMIQGISVQLGGETRKIKPLFKFRRSMRGNEYFEKLACDMIGDMDDILAAIQSRLGTPALTHSIKGWEESGDVILVVRSNLGASKVRGLWRQYGNRIKAIITDKATLTTHWAVILQGLPNPPAIVIVEDQGEISKLDQIQPDSQILISVDAGKKASVFVHPKEERLAPSLQRKEAQEVICRAERKAMRMPTGGISVFANVVPGELDDLEANGADGVALVRTEVDEDAENLMAQMVILAASKDPGAREKFMAAADRLHHYLKTVYARHAMHPSLRRKVNTWRTFDIWPDKNEGLFQEMQARQLIDDPEQASGINFYKNTVAPNGLRWGEEILIRQIAALLEIETDLIQHLGQDRSLTRILFPHIRTCDDLVYLAEKILPKARELALQNLRKIHPGRTDIQGLLDQAFNGIKFGIMIETPEAVENLKSLLEFQHGGRRFVQFLSVGMNDLEVRLFAKELRKRVEAAGHVNRDMAWMQPYISRLDPIYVQAYYRIVEITASFNRQLLESNSKASVIPICFCGQIAAEDRFAFLVKYFSRKFKTEKDLLVKLAPQTPLLSLSSSMSPARIPHSKSVLRSEMRREEVAMDELFDAFFNDPDAMPDLDQRASVMAQTAGERAQTILRFVEEAQKRFEQSGLGNSIYHSTGDVASEPGSYETIDHLARMVAALESVTIERNEAGELTQEGFRQLLSFLAKKTDQENNHYIEEGDIPELKEAFQFLKKVRDAFLLQKTMDPKGPYADGIFPENAASFIDGIPDQAGAQGKTSEAKIQDFYRLYTHYREVVERVSRFIRLHYLCEIVPPEVRVLHEETVGEDQNALNFEIIEVTGPAIQEEGGLVYGTYYYLTLKNGRAILQENPHGILKVFAQLATENSETHVRLGSATQQFIRAARDRLSDLTGRDRDAAQRFRSGFLNLLKKNSNLGYVISRMNSLRLLVLAFPALEEILYTPFHAAAIRNFQNLEDLIDKKDFVFLQASELFHNISQSDKEIQTLRLAVLLQHVIRHRWEQSGALLTSYQGKVQWAKDQVTPLLNQLGITDETEAWRVGWLIMSQMFLGEKNLIYSTEMAEAILEVAESLRKTPGLHIAQDPVKMENLFSLLYLMQFISQYSDVDPRKNTLLKYEGLVAPLASWDKFYLFGRLLLEGELGDSKEITEEQLTTIVHAAHASFVTGQGVTLKGFSRFVNASSLSGEGPRISRSDFDQIMVRYLRHTEIGVPAVLARNTQKIWEEFSRPDTFQRLLTTYLRGVSVYHARALPLGQRVLEMLMMRHLEDMADAKDRETVLTLFLPLSEAPTAGPIPYRILLGTGYDDPALETFYTRILYQRGFDIGFMNRYCFPGKDGQTKSTMVEIVGQFMPDERASVEQRLDQIRQDLSAIFHRPKFSLAKLLRQDVFAPPTALSRMDERFGPLRVERLRTTATKTQCAFDPDRSEGSVLNVVTRDSPGLYAFIRAYLERHQGLVIQEACFDDLHGGVTRTGFILTTSSGKPVPEHQKSTIKTALEAYLDAAVVEISTKGRPLIIKEVKPQPAVSFLPKTAAVSADVTSVISAAPAEKSSPGSAGSVQEIEQFQPLRFVEETGDFVAEGVVTNQIGIHARIANPIQKIVRDKKYKKLQSVRVENLENNQQASGDRIEDLIMLAAKQGARVRIRIKGPKEVVEKFLTELKSLKDFSLDSENGELVFGPVLVSPQEPPKQSRSESRSEEPVPSQPDSAPASAPVGESRPVARSIQKILVVDDEPSIRGVMPLFFKRLLGANVEIQVAASGDEALRTLESFKPDAIISDVQMPGMTGPEWVLKAMNGHEGLGRIPVVFISGHIDNLLQFDLATQTLQQAGHSVHFFFKPCQASEIARVLKDAVRSEIRESVIHVKANQVMPEVLGVLPSLPPGVSAIPRPISMGLLTAPLSQEVSDPDTGSALFRPSRRSFLTTLGVFTAGLMAVSGMLRGAETKTGSAQPGLFAFEASAARAMKILDEVRYQASLESLEFRIWEKENFDKVAPVFGKLQSNKDAWEQFSGQSVSPDILGKAQRAFFQNLAAEIGSKIKLPEGYGLDYMEALAWLLYKDLPGFFARHGLVFDLKAKGVKTLLDQTTVAGQTVRSQTSYFPTFVMPEKYFLVLKADARRDLSLSPKILGNDKTPLVLVQPARFSLSSGNVQLAPYQEPWQEGQINEMGFANGASAFLRADLIEQALMRDRDNLQRITLGLFARDFPLREVVTGVRASSATDSQGRTTIKIISYPVTDSASAAGYAAMKLMVMAMREKVDGKDTFDFGLWQSAVHLETAVHEIKHVDDNHASVWRVLYQVFQADEDKRVRQEDIAQAEVLIEQSARLTSLKKTPIAYLRSLLATAQAGGQPSSNYEKAQTGILAAVLKEVNANPGRYGIEVDQGLKLDKETQVVAQFYRIAEKLERVDALYTAVRTALNLDARAAALAAKYSFLDPVPKTKTSVRSEMREQSSATVHDQRSTLSPKDSALSVARATSSAMSRSEMRVGTEQIDFREFGREIILREKIHFVFPPAMENQLVYKLGDPLETISRQPWVEVLSLQRPESRLKIEIDEAGRRYILTYVPDDKSAVPIVTYMPMFNEEAGLRQSNKLYFQPAFCAFYDVHFGIPLSPGPDRKRKIREHLENLLRANPDLLRPIPATNTDGYIQFWGRLLLPGFYYKHSKQFEPIVDREAQPRFVMLREKANPDNYVVYEYRETFLESSENGERIDIQPIGDHGRKKRKGYQIRLSEKSREFQDFDSQVQDKLEVKAEQDASSSAFMSFHIDETSFKFSPLVAVQIVSYAGQRRSVSQEANSRMRAIPTTIRRKGDGREIQAQFDNPSLPKAVLIDGITNESGVPVRFRLDQYYNLSVIIRLIDSGELPGMIVSDLVRSTVAPYPELSRTDPPRPRLRNYRYDPGSNQIEPSDDFRHARTFELLSRSEMRTGGRGKESQARGFSATPPKPKTKREQLEAELAAIQDERAALHGKVDPLSRERDMELMRLQGELARRRHSISLDEEIESGEVQPDGTDVFLRSEMREQSSATVNDQRSTLSPKDSALSVARATSSAMSRSEMREQSSATVHDQRSTLSPKDSALSVARATSSAMSRSEMREWGQWTQSEIEQLLSGHDAIPAHLKAQSLALQNVAYTILGLQKESHLPYDKLKGRLANLFKTTRSMIGRWNLMGLLKIPDQTGSVADRPRPDTRLAGPSDMDEHETVVIPENRLYPWATSNLLPALYEFISGNGDLRPLRAVATTMGDSSLTQSWDTMIEEFARWLGDHPVRADHAADIWRSLEWLNKNWLVQQGLVVFLNQTSTANLQQNNFVVAQLVGSKSHDFSESGRTVTQHVVIRPSSQISWDVLHVPEVGLSIVNGDEVKRLAKEINRISHPVVADLIPGRNTLANFLDACTKVFILVNLMQSKNPQLYKHLDHGQTCPAKEKMFLNYLLQAYWIATLRNDNLISKMNLPPTAGPDDFYLKLWNDLPESRLKQRIDGWVASGENHDRDAGRLVHEIIKALSILAYSENPAMTAYLWNVMISSPLQLEKFPFAGLHTPQMLILLLEFLLPVMPGFNTRLLDLRAILGNPQHEAFGAMVMGLALMEPGNQRLGAKRVFSELMGSGHSIDETPFPRINDAGNIVRSEARDESSTAFSVRRTVQKPTRNSVPRTLDFVLNKTRSEARNNRFSTDSVQPTVIMKRELVIGSIQSQLEIVPLEWEVPTVSAAVAMDRIFSDRGVAAVLPGGELAENLQAARQWIAGELIKILQSRHDEGAITNEFLSTRMDAIKRFALTGKPDPASALTRRKVHISLPELSLTEAVDKTPAWNEFIKRFPVIMAVAITMNVDLYLNTSVDADSAKKIEAVLRDEAKRNGIFIGSNQLRVVRARQGKAFASLGLKGVNGADALMAPEVSLLPGSSKKYGTRWFGSPSAKTNVDTLVLEMTELLYAVWDETGRVSKSEPNSIALYSSQQLVAAISNIIQGYLKIRRAA